MPTDRVPRRQSGRLRRRWPRVDLPPASLRTVPEAPRRRAAHRLHEAEASRRRADRL